MLNLTVLNLIKSTFLAPMMFSGRMNYEISYARISKSLGYFLLNPHSFKIEHSQFSMFQKNIVLVESNDIDTCQQITSTDKKFSNCGFFDSTSQLLNISNNSGQNEMNNIQIKNCTATDSLIYINGAHFSSDSITVIDSYSSSKGKGIFDITNSNQNYPSKFISHSYSKSDFYVTNGIPIIYRGKYNVEVKKSNFTYYNAGFEGGISAMKVVSLDGDTNTFEESIFHSNNAPKLLELTLTGYTGLQMDSVTFINNTLYSTSSCICLNTSGNTKDNWDDNAYVKNCQFIENNYFCLHGEKQLKVEFSKFNSELSNSTLLLLIDCEFNYVESETTTFTDIPNESETDTPYESQHSETETDIEYTDMTDITSQNEDTPYVTYQDNDKSNNSSSSTIIIVIVVAFVVVVALVILVIIFMKKRNASPTFEPGSNVDEFDNPVSTVISTNPLQSIDAKDLKIEILSDADEIVL